MLSFEKLKDKDKYKDKGFTGLQNLGNTCFMNSVLQCLSHTYEFSEYLDTGDYKKKLNRKPDSLILLEWDKLRKMMWDENCIISPGGFFTVIRKVARIKDKPLFTGYAQNDLPEFLTFILDCFHESILREVDMKITGEIKNETDKLAKECFTMMQNMYKKEYSEMLQTFYGIHVSKIETLGGDYLSSSPEPFLMLDLAIPNKKQPTLVDCIDKYTEVEILNGDNKVLNEKTNKKEDAEKRIQFWSLPQILIITLKRFSNSNRKNQALVDFPLDNLDLTKYIVGYNKTSYIYELYGICNHSGGVLGGHYTSYVKSINGNWNHFNDQSVTKINESELKSPKAYCFFYRKKK
jgi:ubiquitin carboxyl-terminal hydrolase 8|uniref:USP domain-containing protein n=1 Tax=viral metagenome TaxID=1070528 RepID=A0A6C0C117_9ZZZZ